MYKMLSIIGKTLLVILVTNLLCCGQWYVDRYLHRNLNIPDLGITNPEEALDWVRWNIDYMEEDYPNDRWQTPEYTYAFRTGDCEDMVILWMYLMEKQAGLSGTRLIVVKPNWSVELHVLGWFDGWYYECVGGVRFESIVGYYEEIDRLDYDEVIKEAMQKNITGN